EINSERCSKNGTFSCGICTSCNGIRSGERCECDPDKPIDPKRPDAHCRQTGKRSRGVVCATLTACAMFLGDSRPCSGHGQCVCAKCICDRTFAGEFCQLDESGCFLNGVKCNGHGQCLDNQCQ